MQNSRQIRNQLKNLGRATLDLFYPSPCAGCGEAADSQVQMLCALCLASIPRARSSDIDVARLMTTPNIAPVTSLSALWIYNAGATTGHIQKQLKYGNRPQLGRSLGKLVGIAARNDITRSGHQAPDMVVPVPMSRVRYLERGYNQAYHLALGVSDSLSLVVRSTLKKVGGTRSQTGLARESRVINVSRAFTVDKRETVQGKRILLVDDVWTTGATARAAANTLLSSGAAAVYVAVLALALHS